MEAFIWIAIIALTLAAYPAYRFVSRHLAKKAERKRQEEERQRQAAEAEAALVRRVKEFYDTHIEPLPVAEFTVRWWWYQRLGLFGPWKRFEREQVIEPGPREVFTAAYYYLKAVEEGRIRARNFTAQAELVAYVQNRVRKLYTLNGN